MAITGRLHSLDKVLCPPFFRRTCESLRRASGFGADFGSESASTRTTAENENADFYGELCGKPLAEPTNEQGVEVVLSCIRGPHGVLDREDENQLQKTT